MGLGLVAVGLHAGDFCFQKLDARVQLLSRIAVQAFLRKGAGGVSARSRAIVVFHQVSSIGRCALAVNWRESYDWGCVFLTQQGDRGWRIFCPVQ